MARLEETQDGVAFYGSVDADGDVAAAASVASACASYRRDDEDEDPVGGAVNCFGCRYRRWVPDGFSCTKGWLAALL